MQRNTGQWSIVLSYAFSCLRECSVRCVWFCCSCQICRAVSEIDLWTWAVRIWTWMGANMAWICRGWKINLKLEIVWKVNWADLLPAKSCCMSIYFYQNYQNNLICKYSSKNSYLSNPFIFISGRSHLRSAALGALVIPSSRLVTFGERAFIVTCPRAWNLLPPDLRTAVLSIQTFRKKLKTFLFNSYS